MLIYGIMGYRKKVVYKNLRNSFPEKTEVEIKKIQRDFYRYFFDLIVETVKTLTITANTLRKRLAFDDTSIFKKYFNKNQSIIIVMGHYGNWELGGARFAIEPFHKPVSYTHLRAHETSLHLVCRLLLEKNFFF